jgi:uncharacterized protein DUF5317
MSLLWPVLFGLVLALALGGRLSKIAELRLRGVWLFYVALALQFAAFPLHWMPWHTPEDAGKILWLVSYGVIALAMLPNLRIPGVAVVAVGMVSNIAAISANGGRMPALPSALQDAGLVFHVSRNSARMHDPALAWLVDRWAAPDWLPWGNVFSVGDVTIAIGAVILALHATGVFERFRRAAAKPAPAAH